MHFLQGVMTPFGSWQHWVTLLIRPCSDLTYSTLLGNYTARQSNFGMQLAYSMRSRYNYNRQWIEQHILYVELYHSD